MQCITHQIQLGNQIYCCIILDMQLPCTKPLVNVFLCTMEIKATKHIWFTIYRKQSHDDVIKWKHFPIAGPLCGELTGKFPHKGQWGGALMLSLICAWTKCWVNNPNPDDLRRHRAHYDVTVMSHLLYMFYGMVLFINSPNSTALRINCCWKSVSVPGAGLGNLL